MSYDEFKNAYTTSNSACYSYKAGINHVFNQMSDSEQYGIQEADYFLYVVAEGCYRPSELVYFTIIKWIDASFELVIKWLVIPYPSIASDAERASASDAGTTTVINYKMFQNANLIFGHKEVPTEVLNWNEIKGNFICHIVT